MAWSPGQPALEALALASFSSSHRFHGAYSAGHLKDSLPGMPELPEEAAPVSARMHKRGFTCMVQGFVRSKQHLFLSGLPHAREAPASGQLSLPSRRSQTSLDEEPQHALPADLGMLLLWFGTARIGNSDRNNNF